MKARDFLNLTEQNDAQVLQMAPFDSEQVKQEFQKKFSEFGFSGLVIDEVKFSPTGTTIVLKQGNISSEVTFVYSDDVGPYVAVKSEGIDSVNLDLTPLNPPVVDTAIGKLIDVANLIWLSQEALEGIAAAARIEKISPEELIPAEEVPIGAGSGATPDYAHSFPPMELAAQTVPTPTPKAAVPFELPKENFKKVEKIFEVNKIKDKKQKTPDLDAPTYHQIQIAKRTLKMPDAILGVMGGMTKEQAREILKKYGAEKDEKALPGIKAEAIYRVTFQKGKDIGMIDIDATSESDAEAKAKGKLRPDQKIVSVGKKPTKESKGLTLFRFVIREGKKVKIPVGSVKIKEEARGEIVKVFHSSDLGGLTGDKGEKWLVLFKNVKNPSASEWIWVKSRKEAEDIVKGHEMESESKSNESKKDNTPAWKKKVSKHKEVSKQPREKMKEKKAYQDEETMICPVCVGITGKVYRNCPRCKGRGYIVLEKLITEQQITKRFFIVMANEIKAMPDPVGKKELVDTLIRVFSQENPRFDAERFRLATGV